jgi:DNA-binding IclR family transcriptional regulator
MPRVVDPGGNRKRCVAVFDDDGQLVASLMVAGKLDQTDLDALAQLALAMREFARSKLAEETES